MTKEQIKEQGDFIKNKLPDIFQDINENKGKIFTKDGVIINSISDYADVACFSYANFIVYKGHSIRFRIFISTSTETGIFIRD